MVVDIEFRRTKFKFIFTFIIVLIDDSVELICFSLTIYFDITAPWIAMKFRFGERMRRNIDYSIWVKLKFELRGIQFLN